MISSGSASGRLTVAREAGVLLIRVRAPRSLGTAAVVGLWLCGWVAGELSALTKLASAATPRGGRAFLAAWLTLWTLGGAAALAVLLWTLFGLEELRVEAGRVVLRRSALGLGWSRRFELASLAEVRAEEGVGVSRRPVLGQAPAGWRGGVGFLADGHRRRFGLALPRADADRIVELLRPYAPEAGQRPRPFP